MGQAYPYSTAIFFSVRHSLSGGRDRPPRIPISACDHGENIGAGYPNVLEFGIAHRRKMHIVTMQLAPVNYSIGEFFQGPQHNAQQSAVWPMAVDFECRHLALHLYVFAPSQVPLAPTFSYKDVLSIYLLEYLLDELHTVASSQLCDMRLPDMLARHIEFRPRLLLLL